MITSLLSRQLFAGTGTTGPFGFSFKIFDPSTDLRVIKLLANGVEQTLVYIADFTVVGNKIGVDNYGGGGTVTTTIAVGIGETLLIRRAPPPTQRSSLQNQGPYFPKSLEDQLDYLTMLAQSSFDVVSRALQLRETTDLSSGISPVLPTPIANYTVGWDATGKVLTNIQQGGRGPAGVGGPIPIFNTVGDRDAFYPNPAVDNLAIVKSLGLQMRYGPRTGGGPNAWLPEAFTRGAGPYISAGALGAHGDSGTDDSTYVTALSAIVSVAGTGDWDPGTYFINVDCTLDGRHHFNQGAKFRVANGKTLTIAPTALIQGEHPIFDESLGGKVACNCRQPAQPEWWGALFDSAADDGPAWQRMFNDTPDGSLYRVRSMKRGRIATTVHVHRRGDLSVLCHNFGLITTNTASLFWDGAYGGRIFDIHLCSNFRWEGVNLEPIPANATMVFDANITAGQRDLTTILSQVFSNQMIGCGVVVFGAGFNDGTYIAPLVTKVLTAPGNNHVTLQDNALTTPVGPTRVMIMPQGTSGFPGSTGLDFTGMPGGQSLMFNVGMTNGQNRIRSVASGTKPKNYHDIRNVWYPDMVGRTVNVPAAGIVNATITSVVDNVCAVLSANATSTQANTTGTMELVTGQVWGASTISTQNKVKRCRVAAQIRSPHVELIRFGADASDNHEFYIVDDVQVRGGDFGGSQPFTGVTINIGVNPKSATSTAGWGYTNPIGMRIDIEGAGPAGGLLSTVIDNLSAGVATLRDAASTSVVGAWTMVSEWEGIGILMGNSANAHGHQIISLGYSSMGVAIFCINGGFDVGTLKGSLVECGVYIAQTTRQVTIKQYINEGSCTFIEGGTGVNTIRMIGCNAGGMWPRPHGSLVRPNQSCNFQWEGCGLDSQNTDGINRKVHDHSQITSGHWIEIGTIYGGPTRTMAQLGYLGLADRADLSFYTLIRLEGISDFDAHMMVYSKALSSIHAINTGGVPAIVGEAHVQTNSATIKGVVGKAGSRMDQFDIDPNNAAQNAGVEGQISIGRGPIQGPTAAVQAQLRYEVGASTTGPSDSSKPYHGFRVIPPAYLSGGQPTIALWYGLRIEAQFIDLTHTPDCRGISQEGVSEPNLLGGLTSFGSGRVAKATVYIDIGAGGNATPNVAGAEEYRYRMAGAATVNNPLGLVKGIILKLVMFNNTAGPITPGLGSKFLGTGFGAIGAAKSRSRMYMYDDVLDKLEPMGAVSEDF